MLACLLACLPPHLPARILGARNTPRSAHRPHDTLLHRKVPTLTPSGACHQLHASSRHLFTPICSSSWQQFGTFVSCPTVSPAVLRRSVASSRHRVLFQPASRPSIYHHLTIASASHARSDPVPSTRDIRSSRHRGIRDRRQRTLTTSGSRPIILDATSTARHSATTVLSRHLRSCTSYINPNGPLRGASPLPMYARSQ